jgi:predicted nucleic acid-binding protein
MSVVSDASPIIHLARIGQLDLLRHLYGDKAVWEARAKDRQGLRKSGRQSG